MRSTVTRYIIGGVAVLLVAFVSFVYARSGANLVVTNDGAEELVDLRVAVAGYSFELGAFSPHESKRVKVRSYTDSGWTISGRWKSGELLDEKFGYITGGLNFDDQVKLRKNMAAYFESTAWTFFPPL
jgi:hypothetical protein